MISSNRFLKVFCLFAMLSLVLFVADSETWAGTTGKIAGLITDEATGEPLAGVNVQLEGTSLGAATDLEGLYYIINIPPGSYSVTATMIGYKPVIQEQLRVIADRTTSANFILMAAILESEETVVIIAERPLVQPDVGSSQAITTSAEASTLPVTDIMQAVSMDPGVDVSTTFYEVEVRGGGSNQVRFQVDGMERSDKLNDKVYTPTNSATVQEVQVLSGGFNAEYGNLRSGMFNIISKEGGRQITGSVDYRMAPGQQKHFGPDAYGTDQFDWQSYATPSSFEPVLDVEGNQVFIGWNSLAETKNAETWLGKADWTAQDLQDVWKYRHRGYDYSSSPEHFIDAGLGGPIPGLDNAGFFLGAKYGRQAPIFPTISEFSEILSLEGKLHFKLSSNIKFVVSGLYGTNNTTTDGITWGDKAIMNYSQTTGGDPISPSAAIGEYKYYLSANDLLDATTTQLGLKLTHSLNPSTFYEVRYTYFSTETEAYRGADRNTATQVVINDVAFDEVPVGWLSVANSLVDLPGVYSFYGAGSITDNSYGKSHLLNFDITSQMGNHHMFKGGLEFGSDHVVRDNYRMAPIILDPDAGNFVNYDETPYHIAGYVQDKIEFGGLIANVGLRLEHYSAAGVIYAPDNLYALYWARGGTFGLDSPADLPQVDSESHTYLAPRLSFSHPVGEQTKFFFNYGVYYSEPSSAERFGLHSESWAFGNAQGDIRRIGYASLSAPRTSAYEIGFEQSFSQDWLVRAYFYSKDNSEQVGDIRVDGMDGTHSIGDFRNYEGVGKGAAGYNSSRNNNWQDLRGVEMKLTKMRGRFFTGWLNMNYLVSTEGNYGVIRYNQDPLVGYFAASALKEQPQATPSFLANFNFHTPSDFGSLWGEWRLSIVQSWGQGKKYIYNPTGLPTREVRSIYYWVDDYRTNLRLSKAVHVLDGLNLLLYMDVNNLFDYEGLQFGNLTSDEQSRYLLEVVDGETGLGKKIGDFEDDNGNNVFTENWVDRAGTTRAPIAPEKDFALAYRPRSILFGIKIDF